MAAQPHAHVSHEHFNELLRDTLWCFEFSISKIEKSWPYDSAAADYIETVAERIVALGVQKLGPQTMRDMLNRQLSKIKPVN